MKLGKAIEEVRKKKGLKQAELAEKVGITQAYLSMIENDRKEPTISTLKAIGSALETPLPYIFYLALGEEDISDEKKEVYNSIKESLDLLMQSVI